MSFVVNVSVSVNVYRVVYVCVCLCVCMHESVWAFLFLRRMTKGADEYLLLVLFLLFSCILLYLLFTAFWFGCFALVCAFCTVDDCMLFSQQIMPYFECLTPYVYCDNHKSFFLDCDTSVNML